MLNLLLAATTFAQAPPPVVNGVETEDYPQVGALMVKYGAFWSSFCSGTLVHAEWVVTAAHCVEAIRTGMEVEFWLGTDLRSSPGVLGTAPVDDWIAHPDYDERTLRGDIGLVHLVGGFPDVRPMPVNRDPVDDAWVGLELDFVGFGITSDDAWDSDVKRTADLPIYDYDTSLVYVYDGTGQNLCSGDSGGAGLLPLDDGTWLLAGVNSFVYPVADWSSYCVGGGAGATRVDAYVDWVESYVPLEEAEAWTDPAAGDPDAAPGETGAILDDEPVRPSGEGASVGGCATVAAAGGWWWALAGLAALCRRGRRTT